MSLPPFPSLSLDHNIYNTKDEMDFDWTAEQELLLEWKKEHERLYVCIPKEKLEQHLEWLDTKAFYGGRVMKDVLEKKKKSLLGLDGCKICGKPVKNGTSFCLKHIVEILQEPNK